MHGEWKRKQKNLMKPRQVPPLQTNQITNHVCLFVCTSLFCLCYSKHLCLNRMYGNIKICPSMTIFCVEMMDLIAISQVCITQLYVLCAHPDMIVICYQQNINNYCHEPFSQLSHYLSCSKHCHFVWVNCCDVNNKVSISFN